MTLNKKESVRTSPTNTTNKLKYPSAYTTTEIENIVDHSDDTNAYKVVTEEEMDSIVFT